MFREGQKKQFEKVKLNGWIPPRLSSLHFTSFHLDFLWKEGKKERRKEGKKERRKEGKKEGRSVIPTRSLQLLVGNPFPILWVILKAFAVSHFTRLDPEETFKSPALQMMNKCSLF
jgi:hypothetical protein